MTSGRPPRRATSVPRERVHRPRHGDDRSMELGERTERRSRVGSHPRNPADLVGRSGVI